MAVEIALIDGGIREGYLEESIIERIRFAGPSLSGHGGRTGDLHGAACARVIQSLCPEAGFYDLAITGKTETASVETLLKALRWCAGRGVRLIHMSMGTVNYHDFQKLENAVGELTKKGTILTAAYHNENIRTAPASFPCVFGVRSDRGGMLQNGEFYFQRTEDRQAENTIVAHMDRIEMGDGKTVCSENSNSFAAPAVTGVIARYLEKEGKRSFQDIRRYLLDHEAGEKIPGCGERIGTLLPENGDEIRSITVVVEETAGGELFSLLESLRGDGYRIEVISGSSGDGPFIPLSWFQTEQRITQRLLQHLDRVYAPDAAVFLLGRDAFYKNRDNPLADLLIESDGGRLKAVCGGRAYACRGGGEAASVIKEIWGVHGFA